MKKGFTLLIAILSSSLFLLIGAAIFKIAYTQLTLSSIGKDSQKAFYAADTGSECALYYERKYYPGGDDSSGSAFNVGALINPADPVAYTDSNRYKLINGTLLVSDIQCGGAAVTGFTTGGNSADTVFNINTSSYCATVDVLKEWVVGGALGDHLRTTITSRGYNTCDTTNTRRVERTIQIILE